ncbi:MAG: DUF1330 domain-containing protein [Xanthobacteraceae bacterium]
MSAYWICEHDINDVVKFGDYLRQAMPIIARFGGHYLTRTGSHEVLEGEWRPNRIAVVEFPEMAALQAFYGSPEYQALIALRNTAAKNVILAADGK